MKGYMKTLVVAGVLFLCGGTAQAASKEEVFDALRHAWVAWKALPLLHQYGATGSILGEDRIASFDDMYMAADRLRSVGLHVLADDIADYLRDPSCSQEARAGHFRTRAPIGTQHAVSARRPLIEELLAIGWQVPSAVALRMMRNSYVTRPHGIFMSEERRVRNEEILNNVAAVVGAVDDREALAIERMHTFANKMVGDPQPWRAIRLIEELRRIVKEWDDSFPPLDWDE